MSAANTNNNGEYVFSGNETSSPPYQLDSSSATGVDGLVTAPAPRLIQDATGVTFAVSLTAQQIFDHEDSSGAPDASNVFLAVNSLATALAANDQAGITAAVGSLQTAQGYLAQQLQFYRRCPGSDRQCDGRGSEVPASGSDLAQSGARHGRGILQRGSDPGANQLSSRRAG